MKLILIIFVFLTGCTAFTAEKHPITGIRMDAPAEWSDINPLDTPETYDFIPISHGSFGPGWLYR